MVEIHSQFVPVAQAQKWGIHMAILYLYFQAVKLNRP